MASIDLSSYSFDALIFDCDGTLVNSAPLHYEAFNEALSQQGATLSEEWYFARLSLSRAELLSEFNQLFGHSINESEAVYTSEIEFLKRVEYLEVLPEVAELAYQYYGKVPLAVASSGQRLSVTCALQAVGMLSLFEHLITADDVSECKPSPDVFLKAAQRLEVDPWRCLIFEDTDDGIEAATRAGCPAVDVREYASMYNAISNT